MPLLTCVHTMYINYILTLDSQPPRPDNFFNGAFFLKEDDNTGTDGETRAILN